ncbi:MAG: metallophosphoesterase [Candidatus Micrarchaeia archaeon]
MLKLLAFSDLHGSRYALDRLKALFAGRKYDAVLICGDIIDYSGIGFLDELLASMGTTPCFAIPGNIDTPDVSRRLAEAGVSVDRQVRAFNGFEVFGIGGAVRGPFGTPNEYDDNELWARLQKIALNHPSIVLSHSPPYGFFDDVGGAHVGSRSVLKFMDRNMPVLLACGHIHQHEGIVRHGKTTIVKLPAAKEKGAATITIRNSAGEYAVEMQKIRL